MGVGRDWGWVGYSRNSVQAENMFCLAHAVFFKSKIKPIF